MSSFVIDASVAIKWLVNEEGTSQATKLRRHTLSAPDLLASECANILWKKVRLRELTLREASLASRLIERSDIQLIPGRHLVPRAVEIAIALDHSAYDCMYLALAEQTARPFVTADARLLQKLARDRTGGPAVTPVDLAKFEG